MQELELVRAEILARLTPLDSETIELDAAMGRVLATSVRASESLPPFANSSMDGFALRSADVQSARPDAPVRLAVVATIEAGRAQVPTVGAQQAARIFTGAPLPACADAVLPFEHAQNFSDRHVEVATRVAALHNVRVAGEECRSGEIVFAAGTMLNPAAIGLLAALGAARVTVMRRPRVAVHASGDELVAITAPLGPGQIRNSNLSAICARLVAWGAIPLARPILRDTPEAVRAGFAATLALKPDAIITTGGISAGDRDYIRDVARELGDDVQVRRVNMKPGKPLVDGKLGGVPYFGLPGNPAAALVSFEVFVRPALAQLENRPDGMAPRVWARSHARQSLPRTDRPQFLRARVAIDATRGDYVLEPFGAQGSHLLGSFAHANCLVRVAAQRDALEPDEKVEVWLL
ncbi:MAG: gephyrin-like molybdotransferase Glp [Planctomycetota bacterium]